jgi:hypothetical protein
MERDGDTDADTPAASATRAEFEDDSELLGTLARKGNPQALVNARGSRERGSTRNSAALVHRFLADSRTWKMR